MTAYVFAVSNTPSSVSIGSSLPSQTYALSPGPFEVKVSSIVYGVTTVAASDTQITPRVGYAPGLFRYSSGSASGGSSVTPVGFRAGAAAASATARWGTGVSISGTGTTLYYPLPVTATNTSDASVNYTFPTDLIVSPGSVLVFTTGGMGTGGSGGIGATITATIQVRFYFEELRLSWHT